MRCWLLLIIVIPWTVSHVSMLHAEDATPKKLSPHEVLRISACELTYPGGMLFHTAFYEGYTTRFLLLMAILRSEELAQYFSLDERQQLHLKILQRVTLTDELRLTLLDENAQPDEQLINPDYFAFLNEDQLRRLDILALRFDGYLALTRKSLAERIGLSKESQAKIAKAALELREAVILPRFRWEFAATLPNDIKYRNCLFAGSVSTQLNLTIIDLMTDQECERLHNLLADTLDQKMISVAEQIAVLPDGVWALFQEKNQP